MKIQFTYSHLNGFEWLLHHHPKLWEENKESIENVDSEKCKTKTMFPKCVKQMREPLEDVEVESEAKTF